MTSAPDDLPKRITREEFILAIEAVRHFEAEGEDLPPGCFETMQYYVQSRLKAVTKGRGSDADIVQICAWYWPDIVLDDWQPELIRQIVSGVYSPMQEVLVKGCTGSGKGFSISIAANLWYEANRKVCKVVINAPTHNHAVATMFAEISKLRRKMRGIDPSTIFKTSIQEHEQRYIKVMCPKDAESISGQHSPATLFIFDEGSMVQRAYWDQAATQCQLRVAASNPRTISGWFYECFPKNNPDEDQIMRISGGLRFLKTISAEECRNVITGKAEIPGQITREKLKSIKEKSPAFYRVMGLGKFPIEDETKQVILSSWIDRHKNAHNKDIAIEAFALDVARSIKGDQSILSAGGAQGLHSQLTKQSANLSEVQGWAIDVILKTYGIDLIKSQIPIAVDDQGVGGGLADGLKELGARVIMVKDRKLVNKVQFFNARAEMWGNLSNRLNPDGPWGGSEETGDPGEAWAIPDDPELIQDLLAGEKIMQSDGVKWQLIPKKKKDKNDTRTTFQEKIGRSPDKGDSAVYLYDVVHKMLAGGIVDRTLKEPLICTEDRARESAPITKEEVDNMPDFLKGVLDDPMFLGFDLEEDAGGIDIENSPELSNLMRAFRPT